MADQVSAYVIYEWSLRRQIRPNQQTGSIRRSQYGLDAMSLENVARSHRSRFRSEISFVCYKGQLISECPFDFPKNHQFDKFLPKDLKSGQIIREMSLNTLNSPYNHM